MFVIAARLARPPFRAHRIAAWLAATALAPLGADRTAAQSAIDLPTLTVQSDGEGDGEARSANTSAWGPVQGYIAENSAAGTKTDTPILVTPRSISVVTRDEMDDRGVQNVVDAVSYTAGVLTGAYGYDPRFDDIYLRGFPVTSRGDYRDGLSQASGNFAYWRTETYGLERIDIIKGPAAALYGQTVPGGLIDRISKMPLDRNFAEAEVQIGDPEWYQAAFDLNAKGNADGSALFRITGVARSGQGAFEGTSNDALYLAPSATFQNDSTRLTVLANVLDVKLPASTSYWQPNGVLTKIPLGTSYNAGNQTQEQVGYRLEHDFDDTWTARQNLRYGNIANHSYWLEPTGIVSGPLIGVYAADYIESLNTFQVDTQLQAKFATGPVEHKVLGGLDYLWGDSNFGIGYGGTAAPINIFDPLLPNLVLPPAINDRYGVTLDQVGLYFQDQMSFSEGWHFSIGGRQDFVSQDQTYTGIQIASRDDRAFTWQAGLLYEFAAGVSPYVSYATSFMPSSNMDASGQLLEPSSGEQYEAGVKVQPKGGRSFFTLATYQITQNNYAVPDPTGFYYSAVGNVRVRGFEAEALVEMARGLDLTAAYTCTKGTIISSPDLLTIGNTPVNMPANVASLWMKYTFLDGALRGFGGGVGIRYVGEYYSDNLNTYRNPAQFPVDAALYYEKDDWKLALNARNLFDQQEALANEGYWYWQQGRTVLATARYRW